MELAQQGAGGQTPYVVVVVTAASEEEATRIGRELVEQRLAACANILPNVRSIFRWEGKIAEEQEFLLLVKSRRELFEEISIAVKRHHSYQVPEIIAVGIESGLSDYLDWIGESTHK